MHEHIFEIVSVWLLVVLSAESCEALITQVSFYWVEPLNQAVKTEIELFTVDQNGCFDVALNQQIGVRVTPEVSWNVFEFVY